MAVANTILEIVINRLRSVRLCCGKFTVSVHLRCHWCVRCWSGCCDWLDLCVEGARMLRRCRLYVPHVAIANVWLSHQFHQQTSPASSAVHDEQRSRELHSLTGTSLSLPYFRPRPTLTCLFTLPEWRSDADYDAALVDPVASPKCQYEVINQSINQSIRIFLTW